MAYPVWLWPNSVVTRVIDGDSIVAHLTKDIGFHGVVTFDQKLRLNRINAKPATTILGKAALDYLTLLLIGNVVFLETVAPYKYGDEFMVEITFPNGNNVSDLMVTNGHAVYWNGQGPRPGG